MKRHYLYLLASVLWVACTESVLDESYTIPHENVIQVGGVETDELSVSTELTRATEGERKDAETEVWLRTPLKDGLDITYGRVNGTNTEKAVAKLKLVVNNAPQDGQDYGTYNSDKGYNEKNGLAVYTFRTLNQDGTEGNPAIWFGNGAHYFQGVYVPENIRYGTTNTAKNPEDIDKAGGTAPNLTTDLSATGDDSNFTLLERYLGMPANTRLSATIERIKLPFRHRLAHVIVYILIDPSISGATINGYRGGKNDDGTFKNDTEDPKTSSILFRNVMMLKGVQDEYDDATKLHTLTPQWENFVPRVTPHFFGEHGSVYSNEHPVPGAENNFILFTHNRTKATLFPTDDSKWDAVKTEWEGRKETYLKKHESDDDKEAKAIEYANQGTYTRVDYGLVPCYDIILRPTYTTEANVMYDEDGYSNETTRANIAALKNNIDFDIVLSNDLQYEKSVAIDLNANEETVVYLRISRESIDYNTSGAEKWIRDTANDGWYGLNNKNGNTLSKAGSSWQRAYTYGATVDETAGTTSGVTDGQFYNTTTSHEEQENAQYYTEAYHDQWVEKFLQARQGGEHHGDYFALKSPISIDARLIPQDFVFTGHLDGQDSTITLTHTGEQLYKTAEDLTELYTKEGEVYSAYTVPEHLYKSHVTEATYYTVDDLQDIDGTTYLKTSVEWVDATYYESAEEYNAAKGLDGSDGKTPLTEDEFAALSDEAKLKDAGHWNMTNAVRKAEGDEKTPRTVSFTDETITLDLLLHGTDLFLDESENHPFQNPTALYQKSHLSPAYLFAGLDGTYTTAQEAPGANSSTVWEANVHKETNNLWVPVAGYRAEVLNVKVTGGTDQLPAAMFPDDAIFSSKATGGQTATVTGNVQNCFNGSTPIDNNTPDLPRYK